MNEFDYKVYRLNKKEQFIAPCDIILKKVLANENFSTYDELKFRHIIFKNLKILLLVKPQNFQLNLVECDIEIKKGEQITYTGKQNFIQLIYINKK